MLKHPLKFFSEGVFVLCFFYFLPILLGGFFGLAVAVSIVFSVFYILRQVLLGYIMVCVVMGIKIGGL